MVDELVSGLIYRTFIRNLEQVLHRLTQEIKEEQVSLGFTHDEEKKPEAPIIQETSHEQPTEAAGSTATADPSSSMPLSSLNSEESPE